MEYVRRIAMRQPTPVALNNLYAFGRDARQNPAVRLRNAQFLHSELQIRIAQRVVALEGLPMDISRTSHIKDVIGWYSTYFDRIACSPFPETEQDEHDFTDLLQFVLQDNSEVIETTSRGVIQVKNERSGFSKVEQQQVDRALNKFYLSRIGLRFLIEHHIMASNPPEGFAGIIQSDCKPVEYIAMAAEEATRLADYHLGISPEFTWNEVGMSPGNEHISFTYVPGHLMYMLLEILKNSARATVETHMDRDELPKVNVTVVNGKNDITIRVSDEGGGIKRENLKEIWSYLHSTACDPGIHSSQVAPGGEDFSPSALAGYGVGLPLSRLYARYFGGDLDIKSLEGYGTDAYLHLSRLGTNCENLPETVMKSPAEGDSTLARGQSGVFFFEEGNQWRDRSS